MIKTLICSELTLILELGELKSDLKRTYFAVGITNITHTHNHKNGTTRETMHHMFIRFTISTQKRSTLNV